MKTIKRELLLCAALSAFVFVCALAWGSPFLAIGSGSVAAYSQPARSAQFKGTIVASGGQFLLRDGSGHAFPLDNPQRVQSFAGKNVTITGTQSASKTIHVNRIESATI